MPCRRGRPAAWFALGVLAVLTVRPGPVHAQDAAPDERPAFSLASGTMGSSRERPAIDLTFRRVAHLDFRVYRVVDPMVFMAGLKDPHQLGSEEPLVDQEPTVLERIANWKAARRAEVRSFVRAQFSHAYRVERRRRSDTEQVVLRRTLRVNTFAQVPLLNASQLVTSWREMLPDVRDAEYRRIPLDLAEPGLYVVEAVHAPLKAYTVVIVTDVGVVSKAAPGQVLLFAANRFTGEPVGGCDVRVLAERTSIADGVTQADGTFTAALPQSTADDVVAVTRCGAQVAATDPGGWYLRVKPRELVGYLYTDKPIYRPDHTVHLKAVLRWRAQGSLIPFDRPSVEIRVTDPTDKVVFRETRQVDPFGAVHARWSVPAGAALGYYSVQVVSQDDEAGGSFEVQEYRKPEYEVRLAPAERLVVQGGPVRVTVDARYYFGQPVARGRVRYVVRKQPYYSPVRWDDDADGSDGGGWWYAGDETSEGTARLADDGTVQVDVPTDADADGRDYSLRIEAHVTDAGGREVSGNTIVHATYGSFLLLATQDEYVKRPGATATLSVRTVDYQGRPRAGVQVSTWLERRVARGNWDEAAGRTVVAEGTVTTDADGRGTWTATLPQEPGDYRLRAAADVEGRVLQDTAHLWVAGPTERADEGYQFDRHLELIADKRSYAPGDTARVLVRGEDFSGPVLVTKEDQDVSWHAVVRASANAAIEVPITEDDIGDTWVNVVFLKDDRLFRAERRLGVPAAARALRLAIEPAAPKARPRQPATFVVKATDALGNPVRAQVSVGVIDEAVYGVKPDATPDPLRFFYKREYSRVGTQFSRQYAFVGYSGTQELTLAQRRRPHGLADFKGDRARPQVRKDFPDAIFWQPDIVTGPDGTATIQVTYPDALTTWRLTARAVTADTRVGAGIARTTTTKDLIVRAVTPRFLTQGDTVVVPVVTHNYLPGTERVTVSLASEGLTPVTAGASAESPRSIDVPTREERRLDWTFKADRVGPVTVTAEAAAASEGDALQVTLPVLPSGIKTEVSQVGSWTGAGSHTISLEVPDASNPAARTIDVSLAPSMAGSLLGALDFLTSYPYGCTEQILSSFLPNLVVSRTLVQLELAPTERLKALDRQVTSGLKRLAEQQHTDGGWGWWKTDENHPFMTAYALYGLVEARANGYKIDEWKARQGAEALVALYAKYPRAVPALKAYMLFVLVRADTALPGASGSFDRRAALDQLWGSRADLTPYGRALILQTLTLMKDGRADTLARELLAEVTHTGDLAWWKVDHDPLLEDWGDTTVEATAMAVQALAAREAQNPVLEAAVRYLLLNRSAGTYWGSTKQTAMVLYGLLDYLRARREVPAPITVDVLVNGASAGSVTMTAAAITAAEPVHVTAPASAGANAVVLTTRGEGALYWSATARYYDTRTPIERSGSRRLAIVRRYFSLAAVTVKGRAVYRETPFAGTAQPGDVLLVRISVAGSPDWRYLAIEDPLPAGTEPIAEDDLYALETGTTRDWWWAGRREFRDDRAVFFRDRLPEGRMDLHYLLKVTTPGSFTAMPARVTPMYVPGASASSDVQQVTVTAGGAQ